MPRDAQTYFNTFANFESRLSQLHPSSLNLKRMHLLLDALGRPDRRLRFIHVAGTKGKGSTCALTAYILRAAGYRVGLYTSPHLHRLNERIRVLDPQATDAALGDDFDGSITDRALESLVAKIRPTIEKIRYNSTLGDLTYFEVLTGLAMVYFLRRKTDIVVLETGLGGRLDATNAVSAVVDGITPVSFDHMALLGQTIAAIAAEKAAIIKEPHTRVVIARQQPAARRVIAARCRRFGIQPRSVGKEIRLQIAGREFSVTTPQRKYAKLRLALAGRHQRENAAMAVAMAEESGLTITPSAVARGLRQARWPGRLETIGKNPTVVVDCAHNTASAQVLANAIREEFPGRAVILVLGLSNDKDVPGVSRILGRCARLVVTTEARHPRAHHFSRKELEKLFRRQPVVHRPTAQEALTTARTEAGPQDIILVAGSVFLAAEARRLVRH